MWTIPAAPMNLSRPPVLTVELSHLLETNIPTLTIETARAAIEQACARELAWLDYETDLSKAQADLIASLRGFLVMLWCRRALQGQTAHEAFFIRSNQLTMTQHDTDNGGPLCEVGMAPVRPGGFVVFRIYVIVAPQ